MDIDELIAAKNRGVDVQVILDNKGVTTEKPNGAFARLTAAGVKAMKSRTSAIRVAAFGATESQPATGVGAP